MKLKFNLNIKKFTNLLLVFLLYFICILINSNIGLMLLYLYSLIILWINCSKNSISLILIFYITLYFIPIFLWCLYGINISHYTYMNSTENIFTTLKVQTFFSILLSYNVNYIDRESHIIYTFDDFKKNKSNILFILMIILCLICLIIGKSGNTIFESGGYGLSNKTGSAVFEYFNIFYLLAFLFSGNEKNKKFLLYLISIIYVLKSFLYGGRIEIIQHIFLIFILFFEKKFKPKNVLFMLCIGYFVMFLIGSFRSNLVLDINSFQKLFGYNSITNSIVSNEADVFYSTTVFLNAEKYGIIDNNYRIISSIFWIIRLFVPSSFIDETYNVILYLQNNFTIFGGGGFFSGFVFFYFGYIGLIIVTKIISIFINKINRTDNNIYIKTFIILFVVMLPRWYAYSSETFFKIPFYAVALLYLLRIFFIEKNRYF
ncbi:MAG: hypothetical protein UJ210_00010 [Massilimicrobiota sp.]|nr:hypothetical protein [Massilimicrobiota sp.]